MRYSDWRRANTSTPYALHPAAELAAVEEEDAQRMAQHTWVDVASLGATIDKAMKQLGIPKMRPGDGRA